MTWPLGRVLATRGWSACRPGLRPLGYARSRLCQPKARRELGLEAVPAILVPPVVFGGLLVTLWTYKCLMMVVFQNKIIYMPSVPPFSRSEKVAEYANQCKPVQWKEHDVRAVDGTALKLLEGSIDRGDVRAQSQASRLVVVYFQGNASSLPPRLPYLSSILKATSSESALDICIVALSYRGFWTSKGRASQAGIELDAEAALDWVLKEHGSSENIVIWGQSIGAGVACVSAATLSRRNPSGFKRIRGLLLETPFVDVKAMLIALYPQKYLPYRYLSPFLKSTWDSKTALEQLGNSCPDVRVTLLQAGDDEIVPDGQAAALEDTCRQRGIKTERYVIPGALHTDIMMKGQGKGHIVRFLKSFSGDERNEIR